MTDQNFLIWIHERLVNVHKENELYDYMHKLRAIISAIPPDQVTKTNKAYNSLADLLKDINTRAGLTE